MKHLKIYENYNDDLIREICKYYGIENFKINPDNSIDVHNRNGRICYVNLSNKLYLAQHLRKYAHNNIISVFAPGSIPRFQDDIDNPKIPIKFNRVDCYFNISYNHLKDLENCPIYVEHDFICTHNLITTLIGCPTKIMGGLNCSSNRLINLYGFPENFFGPFNFVNNPVNDIINLVPELKRRNFIYWLNDYNVIRGEFKPNKPPCIIKDRLEAALAQVGVELEEIEFKRYYTLI